MPIKEKLTIQGNSQRWPLVVDANAVAKLKTDAETQYLVIPVKSKPGRKITPNMSNKDNVEEKINALLLSLGIDNAVVSMHGLNFEKDENQNDFDIFKGLDEYRSENERRKDDLKKYILTDSEWLNGRQLSELAGFENKFHSNGPSTWKSRKKIFAVMQKGKNLYPRYCLDEGFQPLPVVKEILDIFDNTKNGWSLAFWFGTNNSRLKGKKPKEVLNGDKSKLIKAAKAAMDDIQHG